MNSLTVTTKDELKSALKTKNITEIIIQNDELKKQIKTIGLIKTSAPWIIGALCIAIPLIPFTGGTSLAAPLAGFAFSGAAASLGGATAATGVATSTIVTLCIAIGGTLVISLFTDWEEVEIAGVFKLKRKSRN